MGGKQKDVQRKDSNMLDMVQPPVPDAKFKRLVERWRVEFGDPPRPDAEPDLHCINYQIYNMVLNAAVFKLIARSRSLAARRADGSLRVNGLFHRFIDTNYMHTQMLSLRKLLENRKDPPSDPNKKDNSVYSLKGIVDDVLENIQLFTRENVFGVRGMCLDAEVCEALVKAKELGLPLSTCGSIRLAASHDPFWIRQLHKTFNQVAGLDLSSTAASDSLSDESLAWVNHEMHYLWWVYEHCNKFIAHAATESSRRQLAEEYRSFAFDKMDQTIERLCRLASFLDICLVRDTSTQYLPLVPGDPCEHMDVPLVETVHVDELRREWRAFDQEVAKWSESPAVWRGGPPPEARPTAPGTRSPTAGDPAAG